VYKIPLEEVAPEPQKVEPTFNRVSRQIAVEELPSSTLRAKQFTNKAEPNFNKIQSPSAEQLSQTESPEAKSYLSLKTEESRPLSVSQTSPQIQGNGLKGLAVQAAIKVLETALRPFGPIGKQVLEILRSAGNAFGTIASNPQAFLSNLVKAVQTGFQQFASKIGTHLKNGLIAWLTGTLGSTVSMPAKLDARGVVSLVLQVLGINYGRFRGLLANRIGPAKVERLERGFDLVKRLAKDGFPAAIQEMMQSAKSLETFQKTVVEGIRNWVIETVVKKAVAFLVKTFTGFGAIANAIEGIYNAISFLIVQASQIQALVNAVRDSIGNIAAGQIGTAATFIESALARSLSLTINFLARFVGLGNVGQKVREIIERVRVRVDAAVNKLIEYVAQQGNSWLAKGGARRSSNTAGASNKSGSGQRPVGGQSNGNRRPIVVPEQSKRFEMYGKPHTLYMYLKNGQCGVDIASRREYFVDVLQKAITHFQNMYGPGKNTEPLPALRTFLKTVKEYKHDLNLAASRASTEAQVTNEMHKYLDKLAGKLKQIGDRYQIKDLQKLKDDRRYSSGGELRPEYWNKIRETFYRNFNKASDTNKVKLLEAAKKTAKTKPGYNQFPAAKQPDIYWCENRGPGLQWNPHFADEKKTKEKPALDHMVEVGTHWNTYGYNQSQDERVTWYNDTRNHQVICTHHNSSKSGPQMRRDVGSNFKGPGE
jgi:hypothetical protein